MPAANLAFPDTVPPLHTTCLFFNKLGAPFVPRLLKKRPAVLSTLSLTDPEGHYQL